MRPALSIDCGPSHTLAMLRRPDGQVRPLLFGSSPLLPSRVYAAGSELDTGPQAQQRVLGDPARTGISVATSENTVDIDWQQVRTVTPIGDNGFLIEMSHPLDSGDYHGSGMRIDDQFLQLGPIDAVHMDELHDVLATVRGSTSRHP